MQAITHNLYHTDLHEFYVKNLKIWNYENYALLQNTSLQIFYFIHPISGRILMFLKSLPSLSLTQLY